MKKELKIIITIIAVILIAFGIFVLLNMDKFKYLSPIAPEEEIESEEVVVSEEVPEASRQIVEELLRDSEREAEAIVVSEVGEDGQTTARTVNTVVVAPGASHIDTERGRVITPEGRDVDLSEQAGYGDAPRSSFPIEDPDSLPNSTIKVDVTSFSMTPSEFTVSPGQLVNIAFTNTNSSTFSEIVKFEDPSLAALVVSLAKGQTKVMSFTAPSQRGEYVFFSSQFNHRAQGSEGTMIVQ